MVFFEGMPANIALEYTHSEAVIRRTCDGEGIHTIMEEEETQPLTPLHAAVAAKNTNRIKRHLADCVDPNATLNSYGLTPLHLAAKQGDVDVINALLTSRRLLVDTQDVRGKSPLHIAIDVGSYEAASCLLKRGASLGIKDNSGLAPLDYCLNMRESTPNNSRFTEFFSQHVAEISHTALKSDRKCVCILAYWDRADLLRLLLHCDKSAAAFRDKHKQSALHYSFSGDGRLSFDCAKLLLEASADINERNVDGATPLHFLAAHELCEERAAEEFTCNVIKSHSKMEDMSPLHLAAVAGDTDMLKYIAKCGTDVNLPDRDGFTALHLAALHGQSDVTRCLLKIGAEVNPENQRGQIPLHYSSVLSRITCSLMLMQEGAWAHHRDQFGMTPLHKAAGWGTPEMVKLFIQKRVDVNVADNIEQLPIHYSALKGLTETTELLILKGSKVDCCDKNGQTPLHLAAKTGNADIIKLLLFHGADANAQDIKGQSPLHLACCHGNKEAVQTLINRGASKNVMTSNGETPNQFASERGFYGILSILREHRQSLSLYAPEQLKTFEMFRNATAPNRLQSLGLETDESDPEGETELERAHLMETSSTIPEEELTHGTDGEEEEEEDDGDDVGETDVKFDLHGDENGNLRVDSAKEDEEIIYMKPTDSSKSKGCRSSCCVLS